MSAEPKPPKVFISYSHDSRPHLDRVLALADRLRAEGIDCNLDQYEPAPAEGWPRWMDKQFKDADFILVVCTETYCRRFEGREEQGKGLGVKWEGAIITDELYRNETVNKRFIPVLFSDDDAVHVPQKLQHYMRHLLANDNGYEELYRRLTGQPRVIKPPLGRLRSFEPVNKLHALPTGDRRQEFEPIQEEPQPKPATPHKNFVERISNRVILEMVAIPGGAFQMGSNETDEEKPIHQVTLSPFHIGKFQITQSQWQAVMGDNPSHFKGADLPVEQVSWTMAAEFCEKLSALTGKNYRLPTEAEWEYACRAGTATRYHFGDDEALLREYAWYFDNADKQTHPVGRKRPNDCGLHDLSGNVWEWCWDSYDVNYYQQSPEQDPMGASSGNLRMLRGGSWGVSEPYCRSTFRLRLAPDSRYRDVGMRVVCVAKTP
jgi:formylglycine-generating enzyme required for sulfatase activity